MRQVNIRKATVLDIAEMSRVELSATTAFSQLPLAFLQRLPADIPPQNNAFFRSMVVLGTSWVLYDGQEMAGFICTERVIEQNCLHIHEFGIGQPFQQKGLGTRLLRFVIDWAEQQHIRRLTLTTFKEVPWNAPFYKKNGFTVISEENLDARLRALLRYEVEMGLPRAMRCAMELLLS